MVTLGYLLKLRLFELLLLWVALPYELVGVEDLDDEDFDDFDDDFGDEDDGLDYF